MDKKIYWNKWGLWFASVFAILHFVLFLYMAQTPSWPIHFNASGYADRFAPITSLFFVNLINIIVLIAMFESDESEIRSHYHTRFLISGAIASFTTSITFLALILILYAAKQEKPHVPPLYFLYAFLVAVGLAGLAYLLDQLRKDLPEKKQQNEETNFGIPDMKGKKWIYWDTSHKWYWDLIMIALSIILILPISKYGIRGYKIIPAILATVGMLICLGSIGGIQLMLTCRYLKITAGVFRIPFVKIKLENISSAGKISPLTGRLFAIKFMQGSTGIYIKTKSKLTFAVSCNNPEKTVAMINLARQALEELDQQDEKK